MLLVVPTKGFWVKNAMEPLPTWILSSAAARSHQRLHHALAAEGFTGYQYRCIAALAAIAESLSQSDLARATALDRGDVTNTVRSLEERGLVLRAKDPSHGRRILVSLTSTGHEASHRLAEVMTNIQHDVFGRLTDDEVATLVTLLSRVG
ncbi:MarR family transcriptional regulator [Agromyces sp. SYSU K20354]|uniref:MarR family winged helix-turn-helix transcriptional regulator n=1 Tax=Agromyces cavernae TaxID=2898659 RepID=UPI001E639347|nr:MarR family transcriptional regulator [Agromyces cavernae]MCD2442037.1 MarR family transcriptional regulator [Agromyces cavernae]